MANSAMNPQYDPLTAGFLTLATIYNGQLANIVISNGGTGYNGSTTLVIDPSPGNGINATATMTEVNGVINATNITNVGGGYVTAPNVAATGGGGSGAILAANLYQDTYIVKSFNRTGQSPVETDFTNSDGSHRGVRLAAGKETATMTIERRNAAQIPPMAMTTQSYDGSTWVTAKVGKNIAGPTEAPKHELELICVSTP
jgi:hypothetical protein